MTERVAIYVDGANAYFAQKDNLGWWIDWPSFLDVMAEDRELVSARWYQTYNRAPEPEQERFLHHLGLIGFAIRKKQAKQVYDRGSGSYHLRGNLDLELAIDALNDSDHYDTAIFVTGDSAFVPLLETLQSRGKRVMVVATPNNVAVELRQCVGVNFLDLTDLQEDIESEKRAPEPRERAVAPASTAAPAASPAAPGTNGSAAANGDAAVVQDEPEGAYDDAGYDDEYDDDYDEEYDEYDDDGYGNEAPPLPPDPESLDLPEEGEVVRCHVQTVKKYGVFLDLHQHAKTLLHVKDMNRGFVPDAGEFYEVGEEIPVEVVSVDRKKSPPEVRVKVVVTEVEY